MNRWKWKFCMAFSSAVDPNPVVSVSETGYSTNPKPADPDPYFLQVHIVKLSNYLFIAYCTLFLEKLINAEKVSLRSYYKVCFFKIVILYSPSFGENPSPSGCESASFWRRSGSEFGPSLSALKRRRFTTLVFWSSILEFAPMFLYCVHCVYTECQDSGIVRNAYTICHDSGIDMCAYTVCQDSGIDMRAYTVCHDSGIGICAYTVCQDSGIGTCACTVCNDSGIIKSAYTLNAKIQALACVPKLYAKIHALAFVPTPYAMIQALSCAYTVYAMMQALSRVPTLYAIIQALARVPTLYTMVQALACVPTLCSMIQALSRWVSTLYCTCAKIQA